MLDEKWILDIDTTVKVLYGHQEGAEVGYNPQKPGRPAHIIHTYMMAETRLILDSEVLPGKQIPSSYLLPRLLELIDEQPKEKQPSLVRWWTLYTRWIDPEKHREAITSRPLMLYAVAKKIRHAG